MSEYNCIYCKKIIINDIEKYLKMYPEENYIQCPYCGFHIKRETIIMEVSL